MSFRLFGALVFIAGIVAFWTGGNMLGWYLFGLGVLVLCAANIVDAIDRRNKR